MSRCGTRRRSRDRLVTRSDDGYVRYTLLMLSDLQLLGLGAATVVDTVLLMALIERPNRQHVTFWMVALTVAAWLWHSGSFIHTLLMEATHPWPLQVNACAMTSMSIGLLLMPSSLLHGAIRLWHTGVEAKPSSDARYGLCYLPVLALGPMARNLFADPSGEYLSLVESFTTPYVFWLCTTNIIAVATFWGLRRKVALPQAASFFRGMAVMLCTLSLLVVFVVYVAIPQWPEQTGVWQLAASLSPVLPALLFAYHVVRFGFVPLVLERTLVYGAVLAAVFLFHHLALADVTNRLSEQLRVDFAIVEAVAAAALIVGYQPLRQRVAESLRYLLGTRVAGVREQTRQLAARMSEGIDQPIERWLTAITEDVRTLFGVEHSGTWLFSDGARVIGSATSGTAVSAEQAIVMHQLVAESRQHVLTRFTATDQAAQNLLSATGTSTAIAFNHRDLRGLLVLGRKPFNQELGEEELSSLALLTEQLAVTLRNARLQQDRLAAERRALRQENLSTLGLVGQFDRARDQESAVVDPHDLDGDGRGSRSRQPACGRLAADYQRDRPARRDHSTIAGVCSSYTGDERLLHPARIARSHAPHPGASRAATGSAIGNRLR